MQSKPRLPPISLQPKTLVWLRTSLWPGTLIQICSTWFLQTRNPLPWRRGYVPKPRNLCGAGAGHQTEGGRWIKAPLPGREVPHECDNRVFRRCNFPPPGMPVPEEMVVAPRWWCSWEIMSSSPQDDGVRREVVFFFPLWWWCPRKTCVSFYDHGLWGGRCSFLLWHAGILEANVVSPASIRSWPPPWCVYNPHRSNAVSQGWAALHR